MSGINTKFSYKQLYTLKHALLEYVKRKGITDDDFKSEQDLLLKINYQIEEMNERYHI
ncbi:DNA strand exchange inhibitor protein [Bacillus licheniformis]|uniref:hypothetical protein n=1 Tax=Bacillus TaxID=1386 RepID=UPI000317680B|nr:hypothetical protein [Bacillus licheniformis]AMR10739.1 DNA strand exchange inhibitor protein [Bacillus licheniformis]KJH58738.1 DNA strand exchange inhibitor protein [Bacillus licheniformis]KYC83551.1 hypothetical protein B4091_2129 [Bacillus licheniformis]MCM3374148.1 DNA strand exchange inhibitor protein [Bacillus licheniformis]MCM3433569.1 DNA strand exchange inhibitor protein [Bacillus licheniformis]